MAFLTSLALVVPKLTNLIDETRDLRRLGLHDGGRIPPTLPEGVILAARRELRSGETWALHTPSGKCTRHEELFWLAFRLMPNLADCRSPDVAVYWRVAAPSGAHVVRTGRSFSIVRP